MALFPFNTGHLKLSLLIPKLTIEIGDSLPSHVFTMIVLVEVDFENNYFKQVYLSFVFLIYTKFIHKYMIIFPNLTRLIMFVKLVINT